MTEPRRWSRELFDKELEQNDNYAEPCPMCWRVAFTVSRIAAAQLTDMQVLHLYRELYREHRKTCPWKPHEVSDD